MTRSYHPLRICLRNSRPSQSLAELLKDLKTAVPVKLTPASIALGIAQAIAGRLEMLCNWGRVQYLTRTDGTAPAPCVQPCYGGHIPEACGEDEEGWTLKERTFYWNTPAPWYGAHLAISSLAKHSTHHGLTCLFYMSPDQVRATGNPGFGI